MRSNSIAISTLIKAPATKIWSAIADWESQGEWMLQTKVIRTSEIKEGVGVTIEAFTGPLNTFPYNGQARAQGWRDAVSGGSGGLSLAKRLDAGSPQERPKKMKQKK